MSAPVPTLSASDAASLVLIGPVVQLQVQVAPLKGGKRPISWYDPAAITAVPAMEIDSGGVTGFDGEVVHHDVHHRDHPLSRYRGENGISLGFTSHYGVMRGEFGDFLHDGIAGENLLVASDATHTEDEFAGGIVVMTAEGPVDLTRVEVAPPCVEFGKFCLRYPRDRKADAKVAKAVKFLHQGVRGFYATWQPTAEASTSPRIAVGDLVYRRG